MEECRSGHNGAVSKTVSPFLGHVGSNPTSSALENPSGSNPSLPAN